MLTFRRFTVLFFVLLFVLNLYSIFICGTSESFICANMFWFYTGLMVVFFGVSILLAFLPCSDFHHPVLCKGATSEKIVSVTFDDGPQAGHTPQILDILKKNNVPAAFFLTGKNIEGNEDLVRRIFSEGHLAGTHSWSHSYWFDFFIPKAMKRELIRSSEAISSVSGKSPLLFRPPYGVINPMLARALRDLSPVVICWSIRSLDTVVGNPERVLRRITKRLHPGAVILLHDHSAFSQAQLGNLILEVRKEGYNFVPLDELLKIQAYAG